MTRSTADYMVDIVTNNFKDPVMHSMIDLLSTLAIVRKTIDVLNIQCCYSLVRKQEHEPQWVKESNFALTHNKCHRT